MKLHYLDNAATTAVLPAAAQAAGIAMTSVFGNPSSLHRAGQQARELLEQSRKTVASALGVKPDCLYFTGGGSESINTALRGAARKNRHLGKHIISTLLDKGYAYQAGGNIYFDTSKLERYYIFNDFKEEDLNVGVREGVEEDTNKRNKNDFVLWFTKSKFEDQALKWDSPWGVGYPGWHIECSGISMKHLGETIDIHCGGIDNAFPHHTNEIAQSEAFLGHKWCNFWMHVLHLNTNSGKMSKSSGEFLTVSLLEEKGYDPLAYRLFCLQSHYRKSLVFSWENLDNAQVTYNKIINKIAALKPEDGELEQEAFDALRAKFCTAMDNDLNSSLAVTAVYDVLKYKTNDATKRAVLAEFDKVLSLDLIAKSDARREELKKQAVVAGQFTIISESGEADAEVEALIQARQDAKKAKNFAEADRIRDELKAAGIELTDIPHGAKWKRV